MVGTGAVGGMGVGVNPGEGGVLVLRLNILRMNKARAERNTNNCQRNPRSIVAP
jgi:hypothetical protein